MTMVIIAEKPSLAGEIASAIDPSARRGDGFFTAGPGCKVSYCFGHLIEQLKPEEYDPALQKWDLDALPFVPNEWRMRPRSLKNDFGQDVKKDGKLQLDQKIVAQIETIRRLVAGASVVVNAGDADREGQLIVDEILDYVGCKAPVKRLWLQELNAPGIKRALDRMKSNDEYRTLSLAARARSQVDFLIGMNATRGYTKLWQAAGNDGMVHVGRVQTPTLWLVYHREQERANFKSVEHYGVKVTLEHANGSFDSNWVAPENAPFLDAEGRVLKRAEAQRVAKAVEGATGEIESTKTEDKRQGAPLPYTLLDLQKAANKLGFTPAKTLEIVQALYETHKVVSYPRTDCPYLPEEDFSKAGDVIAAVKSNYGQAWQFDGKHDLSLRSAAWNDKKLGAHFGIVPTIGRVSLSALSDAERLVYDMVVRRYLAQFYPVHEFKATVALIRIAGEQFKSTGRMVTVKGWKVLYEASGDDDDAKAPALPVMKEGDPVKVDAVSLQTKRTEPPQLLDGASLLDAMKNAHRYVTDPAVKSRLKDVEGLGTEATRAPTIENLVKHKYMVEVPKKGGKNKGKDYTTTAHGRALLQLVSAELSKPDLTAWCEGKLEEIVEGAMPFERFSAIAEKLTKKIVDELKAPEALSRVPKVESDNTQKCSDCGGTMTVRSTKDKKEKFWGCRAFPVCKHTEPYVEPTKSRKASGPASFKGKPRASTRSAATSPGQDFPI